MSFFRRGGLGRVLLETVDLDGYGLNDIDFQTGINDTYTKYEIEFEDVKRIGASAGGSLLTLQIRIGGILQTSGGQYYWRRSSESSSGPATAPVITGLYGAGVTNAGFLVHGDTGLGGSGTITLYRPRTASTNHRFSFVSQFTHNSGGSMTERFNGGGTTSFPGGDLDGIRLTWSYFSIATGFVKLYGIT